MIKTIHVQNFQSHSDTTLELDPGVNMIIGQSDSGKSAVVRALKWLATNRPLGESFVSWSKKKREAMVKVVMDDETIIVHELGQYGMIAGAKMQEWNAVGTTVPETVVQALNISDLSWQGQLDPPFLLSSSPGEVARTLNEVADLDRIDTALVNINRMARDNRTALTQAVQDKQRLEIDLSAYRGLDDQLKRINQLKDMDRKAGILESMVENGERTLEQIEQVREVMGKTRDTADAEAMLDGLLDMVGQLKNITEIVTRAENKVGEVIRREAYLKHVGEQLEGMETMWHERTKGRCPLCGRTG